VVVHLNLPTRELEFAWGVPTNRGARLSSMVSECLRSSSRDAVLWVRGADGGLALEVDRRLLAISLCSMDGLLIAMQGGLL
jgi:hypothetical protein